MRSMFPPASACLWAESSHTASVQPPQQVSHFYHSKTKPDYSMSCALPVYGLDFEKLLAPAGHLLCVASSKRAMVQSTWWLIIYNLLNCMCPGALEISDDQF